MSAFSKTGLFSDHQDSYLAPRINVGYAIDPVTTLRASTGEFIISHGT
ncbi:MAG: hypothetical protein R3A12_10610 [Ignavibacteria bacterium]